MMINCYVDDETFRRLHAVANHLGRSIEDLAECAISEQAIRAANELRLNIYPPARAVLPVSCS
jgi:hypothetical protein